MKILLNLSNLRKGGGLQVADSVVREWSARGRDQLIVVCGSRQYRDFREKFEGSTHVVVLLSSESTLLAILDLRKFEAMYKPDIAFTLFGPSWWRPRCPHLVGFAIAHYIYRYSPYIVGAGWRRKLMLNLRRAVKWAAFERNSDFLVVETSSAAKALASNFKWPVDKVFVVSNTVHQCFDVYRSSHHGSSDNVVRPKPVQDSRITVLTVSAYYEHKNLEIIPQMVEFINQGASRNNYDFLVTLERGLISCPGNSARGARLHTIGHANIVDCPALYARADIVLCPSLLECFSASYVEAMIMGLPIVAPDLPFVREICGGAALYYDPLDAKSAVAAIHELAASSELRTALGEVGRRLAERIPTASVRAQLYYDTLLIVSARAGWEK